LILEYGSFSFISEKFKLMSTYSHIIFDLDGTLTDNTKGIKNSVRYALQKMHLENIPKEIPDNFIGPPLQWGFKNIFEMNERNTELAVEYFREYYAETGWRENVPYPGIQELMETLQQAGKKMYIATSKLEKYALKIIRYFEFDKYIEQLAGADYSGFKATKPIIISGILETQKLKPSKSIVMIGDTVFDVEGGKELGLSTVAVGYGFGNKEELIHSQPDHFVKNVDELFEILSS
jgi:phosphoglycolate phosphatase